MRTDVVKERKLYIIHVYIYVGIYWNAGFARRRRKERARLVEMADGMAAGRKGVDNANRLAERA